MFGNYYVVISLFFYLNKEFIKRLFLPRKRLYNQRFRITVIKMSNMEKIEIRNVVLKQAFNTTL